MKNDKESNVVCSKASLPSYGWSSSEDPCSCAYVAPKVIQLLRALKVRKVADIGSGNGALCHTLESAGFRPVGVEYDPEGCNLSQHTYPNIPFYNLALESDPTALLQAEGNFDAVISTEVIEHLYSPHHLPLFAKKILKKGGYLLLSTPYHGYFKNLSLAVFNRWDAHHTPLWHGGHIKFWSKATLTKLLLDHGFENVQFYGAGRCPFFWKSMILVAKST